MNDIAEQANVGQAAFYLHYQDKEQLLVASLEEMFSQLRDSIETLSEVLREHNSLKATRLIFQHFAAHHRLYRVLLTEKEAAMVFPRLLEILTQLAEQDVTLKDVAQPKTGIPTSFVAHYVAGAVLGLAVRWPNKPDLQKSDRL